MLLCGIVPNKA